MTLFYWVSLLLALGYVLLMFNYLWAWQAIPYWSVAPDYVPGLSIDVVIPARNEAATIQSCLRSVLANDYPADLFTVWVVDDYSTDTTAAQVQALQSTYPQLRLIRMAECLPADLEGVAFKKQAIATAIAAGSAELIVTTDADCVVPQHWLRHWAAFFAQNSVVMATAPIALRPGTTVLERFQALDTLGMMLITGAGIHQGWMHMGNGANLAYLRTAFAKIEGFRDIAHLASGDDMLLLQKMAAAFPGQIGFVRSREIVVETDAPVGYRGFWEQRLRWATKSSAYDNWRIKGVLVLVFLYCWAIILSGGLLLKQLVPGITVFSVLFLLKSLIDYYFLKRAARFFRRRSLLKGYLISQLHHIVYIALIGLMANLRKTYVWKGRRVY